MDVPENRWSINGAGTEAQWRAFITECGLMPVPRCDKCQFWASRGSMVDIGNCERFTQPNMGVLISASDRFPQLVTHMSFGCVQFKAKP